MKRPVLDEQQLEEMNITLGEAMEYKSEVTISYFRSGAINDFVGVIESANPATNEIKLRTKEGQLHRIKFRDIIAVKANQKGASNV